VRRQAVFIITLQWGSVIVLTAIVYGIFGIISVLPLPLGLSLGALIVFLRVDKDYLRRPLVRSLSRMAGWISAGLVTLLYWGAFLWNPDGFELQMVDVLWVGPVIGFGGGLAGLGCTLIAGDTAASIRSTTLETPP